MTQIHARFNEFIKKASSIHNNKYDYQFVEYVNKRTKVKILCREHGIFTCTPGAHIQKRGCPKCGIQKLHNTTDEFKNRAAEIHSNKYDYSKVNYVDSTTPVIITCPEHGDFEQKPRDHLKGHGCFKCGNESSTKARSHTTNQFIDKAVLIHGNKYDYSKVEYVDNKSLVTIICTEHGDFEQSPKCHLVGKGCPKCGRSAVKELDDFITESNEKHNNKYDYSKVEYVNNITKVEIICKDHGSFFQTPLKHVSNGYGCPKCGNNVKSNTSEFISKASVVHDNKYDYSKVEYVNNKSKIIINCDKHGEFEQLPNSHLLGHGCPQCSNKITKPHKRITDYLDFIDIKYQNNNRDTIGSLELDIWIPDYKFGIEINGLYWHSLRSDNFESHIRLKNLHHNKASLSENNITLYQFWDYEINDNFDLVCSMINHAVSRSNRIYARDCVVKRLNNNDVVDFFNINHMQGHRNASVTYGLFFDNNLVASASFSRHKVYEWEVIRFANSLNTSVVGGFSKLLSKFVKDESPKSLLTFADRRFSTGNLYEKCGFEKLSVTAPNYFYYKNNIIMSRQRCQKHKLANFLDVFDPKLTEHQNMYNNNYGCVYDAGHVKLLKTFN